MAASASMEDKVVADAPHVLSVKKQKVPQSQLGPTISATAINLLVFCAEQKLTAGVGFTVHTAHSEDACDFTVCLPVDKSVAGRGEIQCGEIAGGKAKAAMVKGSYDQFYSDDNLLSGVAGAKETRLYYVKGPKEAPKDPNAWETEVVYIF